MARNDESAELKHSNTDKSATALSPADATVDISVEGLTETSRDSKDKKRKRKQDEGNDVNIASKKSKKAKHSEKQDTAMNDDSTLKANSREPKIKSVKTTKKPKKLRKEEAAVPVPTDTQGVNEDITTEQDFISLEEHPVQASKPDTPASLKDKKKKKTEPKSTVEEPLVDANGIHAPHEETKDPEATEDIVENAEVPTEAASGKKGRFIVFIGNLPFTATTEQLQAHFAKVAPTAIRLATEKKSGKPRGFAFIEFDRFDRMETCLKKYQHSVFPDGKKKEGRKINIELTAGGGGNTESRKSKIQAKNVKLQDERQRDREKREELEAKQDERKAKRDLRQKKSKGGKQELAEITGEEPAQAESGIHPSRLAQMQEPALRDWQPTRKRY